MPRSNPVGSKIAADIEFPVSVTAAAALAAQSTRRSIEIENKAT